MTFTPKSEEELKAESKEFIPLPAAEYDFDVLAAEETVSKKGNPMVMLKLGAWGGESQTHVFDYLMDNQQWKLKQFCAAVGMLEDYEAGTVLPGDCEGKSGRVVLKIEPAKDGYKAKNAVDRYIAAGMAQAKTERPKAAPKFLPRPKPDPDLDVAEEDGLDIPF